ncbi:MAG TPA: hypothetical protein VK515_01850, partial [Rhizomicrobium sp.]|nr:hypothetical protein [Rhizomicrobium sp.]
MGFSRFQTEILLRVTMLVVTLAGLVWIASNTIWYVTMTIFAAAVVAQVLLLMHFATRSGREVARFLDAVAFDDAGVSFTALAGNKTFADLGAAMTRVLDQLRTGRAQREEQSQYLQELVAHIPVALISLGEDGTVQLLNRAARRLFEGACADAAQFARYGQAFATGLESVAPGDSMIVRMERATGALQL